MAVYLEQKHSHLLLTHFNNLYKELDDLYHSLARHYGLSDCAFWILYTIRETDAPCTQSQLCETLSLSKQTIHSALKNLESAGYLKLLPVAGNQKSKQLALTPEGERFAAHTVDKIISMELSAFGCFSASEQALLFRLLAAYVKQLEKGAQAIFLQPFTTQPHI